MIARAFGIRPGSVLLSHTVTHAVPSAPKGLTSVFGMGTGVAPSIQPPGNFEFSNSVSDREWRFMEISTPAEDRGAN